ncbi:MAG TPA: extracellular solute-binding protein [Methanocorpusculum sp.]|nr:extracellular solute-binding protein [Methanocorpusculum sp.]
MYKFEYEPLPSAFFDENGRFKVNTPEGIAALQWIKDNQDKGYYLPDCENLEINDATAFFENGQCAITIGNSALIEAYQLSGIKNIGYVNFPSKDGSGYASSFVCGFMVFDNGDAKKLEVTKDFVRFIYENEEWLAYSAGGVPCSRKISEKYGDSIPGAAMYIANNEHVVDYTANNPNWVGVRAAFWPNIHALLAGEMTAEEAAKAIDASCNAAIEEGYAKSTLHT